MSSSLNPKNLTERLEGKVPTPFEETRAILENTFDVVAEELSTSGHMSLYGFGSFSTTPVKESTRRNPHTGERMVIPAHLRVKFSPAAALARRINREFEELQPVILEEDKPEGLYVKALHYREEYVKVVTPPAGKGTETRRVSQEPNTQEDIPAPSGPVTPEAKPISQEHVIQEAQPVSPEEAAGLHHPPAVPARRRELSAGLRRVFTALAVEAGLVVILGILLLIM